MKLDACQWPTLDPTAMDPNSSSPLLTPPGWMEDTWFSGKFLKISNSSRSWKALDLKVEEPPKKSLFMIADKYNKKRGEPRNI